MKAMLMAIMLIFSLNAEAVDMDVNCMAAAIYAEARGEPNSGQLGVGHVVLNRMANEDKTACQVVKAKGQFSWTSDTKLRYNAFTKAWNFHAMAEKILSGETEDPTHGATYFFNKGVYPSWAKKFQKTARIKNHTFMRDERN